MSDPLVSQYITQAAIARGIDPQIALRVYQSEGAGGWQSNVYKNGQREKSYGPYQLYTGGGLGNEFQQKTGLDPSDPSTWKQNIDFALDKAKEGGWGPWYGAKKVGITGMAGINGAKPMLLGPSNNAGAAPAPSGNAGMDKSLLGNLLNQGGAGGLLGGSGKKDLGKMLLALGAGIASGSTEGWGAGIGRGLGLAHQSKQDSEDDKMRQAMFLRQLLGDQATQTFRDKQLAQGDERNAISRKNAENAGVPAGYERRPDGSFSFKKGGPADPEVIKEHSLARGRGADVPQAVRTEAIKADQAFKTLTTSLDDYEKTVKRTGNVFLPGVDADTVARERTNIQLQMKELFNLGVLNGPDLALMENMLFNPTAGFTSGFSFNPTARVEKSVKGLKEILRGIRNSKTKAIGLPDIEAPSETDDPLGIR
jgi:hypothetical protein